MKIKILFVDDEVNILNGLQRMLRSQQADWDMRFATSGEQALKMLEDDPADVVVSDMRMPKMNGAALLNEVMRLYPRTIRLILSGYSDHDLILRSVGSTHQFLSKPCSSDTLKHTIARSALLSETLHREAIESVVSKIQHIPSLPAFYRELQDLLQTGEANIKDVGAIIAKDVGMTAGILRVVNSAFFGLKRTISSAEEAASFLGTDVVKSLALGINLFQQYEDVSSKYFCIEMLWTQSLHIAAGSRLISKIENAGQKLSDESFAAGLLADCGQLLLSKNCGAAFDDCFVLAASKGLTQSEAEEKIFGTTHAEVGAYLLGLWGLPVPIVEAVAWHHSPLRSNHMEFCPMTAVYAAANLCDDISGTSKFAKEPLDHQFLENVELDGHVDLWISALQEHFQAGNAL